MGRIACIGLLCELEAKPGKCSLNYDTVRIARATKPIQTFLVKIRWHGRINRKPSSFIKMT
jgi:hypothetical protein